MPPLGRAAVGRRELVGRGVGRDAEDGVGIHRPALWRAARAQATERARDRSSGRDPSLSAALSSAAPLTVPLRAARRLAIRAQGLDGPLPRRRPGAADVRAVAERLGCLQLDPTGVVARSQLLVLHARLGPFDPALLDEAAYGERALFEYWAHEASIVCAADAPLHAWAMRRYPWRDSPGARRARAWLEANAGFRAHVLDRLRADGPLPHGEIENRAEHPHESDGWGTPSERSVGRMLDLLWLRGEIGVARRDGGRRLWDLAERCLPPEVTGAPDLGEREVVRRAAQRSLRALGVARVPHVRAHFTRDRYPGLEAAMGELHAGGAVERVAVDGLAGDWWVHAADADALRELAAEDAPWRPRTAILSPFDNLLCDRARAEQLFGFHHRLEIYVPRAKRRWGYFVLPILHGDRLIGRADLAVDRRAGRLDVHALHADPRAPRAGRAIRRALDRLAAWQGAERVDFAGEVPAAWRDGLL